MSGHGVLPLQNMYVPTLDAGFKQPLQWGLGKACQSVNPTPATCSVRLERYRSMTEMQSNLKQSLSTVTQRLATAEAN